ncbi:MAG: hypothetical protein H6709_04350 [Kofleriaceae bacterium]|nr:hypothetical protein [Kofleriaceae bacterium]
MIGRGPWSARAVAVVAAVATAAIATAACRRHRRHDDDGGGGAAAEADGPSVRIAAILRALRGDDGHARDRALRDFAHLVRRKVLTDAEGLAFVRAIPELPALPDEDRDLQREAFHTLDPEIRFVYLPAFDDIAAALRDDGRLALMELLGTTDHEKMATAFVAMLDRFPALAPSGTLAWLTEHPQQGPVLVPALLQRLDRPALQYPILALTLAYLEHDAITVDVLTDAFPAVAEVFDAQVARAAAARGDRDGAWLFTGDYPATRDLVIVSCKLLAWLPDGLVDGRLRQAVALHDPLLATWGIAVRRQLGHRPDAAAVARAALSLDARSNLYASLGGDDDGGRDDRALMPAATRTQEALAASLLARYVAYRTDAGRLPDAIEPLARVEVDVGPPDGVLDTFVFRFRFADGPWLGGAAGPFLRSAEPTVQDFGGTFSDLEPVGARTAAEIGATADLAERWRAYRADDDNDDGDGDGDGDGDAGAADDAP